MAFIYCLFYFLCTNLHIARGQYYAASQSDSFNIAIILGSALIALILVVLAFYFLYYCWIKGLLAEYREEQSRIYGAVQDELKRQPQVLGYKQQAMGQVRHSPQRIEEVNEAAPYQPPVYRQSPVHDVSYDRSITMRAGSPTQIAASNLAAANEFVDSGRRYSPEDQYRTTTTTQYVRSNTMPGVGEPLSYSRPASGMSARSRALDLVGVDYRLDPERQRASDSGNGGSLSYQATFQQKVTSTSTRNRAAYLGSAV